MPLNTSKEVSAFTSKLTPAADICVGLAILFVVLLSIMGNGLVLVICYHRRKKMVDSELLCVNLAVVDFFCCICFYPLSILSSFHHSWLGEEITCVYYGFGCFIFGLCGMFTIATVSIVRYLKTCYSLTYGGHIKGIQDENNKANQCSSVWIKDTNIGLVCVSLWLVATVWSSFPLFGWGEYVPEPYGLSCTVAWRGYHTSTKDAFYVICSFACFTLIPVLFIVVSQCQILYKVSRFSYSLSARGTRHNLRHAEKRLSMMFFCISLGFVIAWAPYAIVSLLFIFHKEPRYMAPEGFVFPALFAKSSHVYNPFIYFYFNKTFQREVHSLLISFYNKLGGNKVGVHASAGHPAPHPIHIQLQEQKCVQKNKFDLSQDRSNSKSRNRGKITHTGSGRTHVRQVYACWGSTSKSGPNKLDKKSLPVSI